MQALLYVIPYALKYYNVHAPTMFWLLNAKQKVFNNSYKRIIKKSVFFFLLQKKEKSGRNLFIKNKRSEMEMKTQFIW